MTNDTVTKCVFIQKESKFLNIDNPLAMIHHMNHGSGLCIYVGL